jgi:hypothetical protein
MAEGRFRPLARSRLELTLACSSVVEIFCVSLYSYEVFGFLDLADRVNSRRLEI